MSPSERPGWPGRGQIARRMSAGLGNAIEERHDPGFQ